MRVLIVTQYFPPERGAVRRLFEFARHFVKNGHQVSVLTAVPNYPDGIVPPKYRGKFFSVEKMDGITVYRSWVLAAANQFPGKRMIGFLTFLVTAVINSFRIKDQFDIVLASTPPVTTPVIGWIISKIRRCKFLIEVRDLQPESSEEFGNLNPSLFTRMIKKVMHSLYHRADRVIGVTDGISEFMLNLGVDPNKVVTIKSGVGAEFFDAGVNGIRRSFGWDDKFLVVYSGTLGWVRPLETVIEAARKLADEPSIHFVFIGDGQKRVALQNMVRDYGLKNVSFIGLQPLETIPYFLKTSDVLIESLKEVAVSRMAFPSKVYEYMAAGRPIIFGGRDGEAIRELNRAGGAITYAPDSPEELSEVIMRLRSGEIDGELLGEKYRKHITLHHHRQVWADKYQKFLEEIPV